MLDQTIRVRIAIVPRIRRDEFASAVLELADERSRDRSFLGVAVELAPLMSLGIVEEQVHPLPMEVVRPVDLDLFERCLAAPYRARRDRPVELDLMLSARKRILDSPYLRVPGADNEVEVV